jgi:hypothetical protein
LNLQKRDQYKREILFWEDSMKKSKLTILTVLMIVFALVTVACGPAKPATTTKAPVYTDAPATDGRA